MATFRWTSWDPFSGLRTMQREIERLFGRDSGTSRSVGGGVYPPVNVFNAPDEVVVECELSGVQRDDLDLSITGETLVVKGRKDPPVEEGASVRFHRNERGHGDFSRTIVLPDKVEAEKISAELRNGVLTVRLPKSEAAQPRRIEVQ